MMGLHWDMSGIIVGTYHSSQRYISGLFQGCPFFPELGKAWEPVKWDPKIVPFKYYWASFETRNYPKEKLLGISRSPK